MSAHLPTRKRSWHGRFVKNLRPTPDDSREWLIWSHYHGAWHCRSSEGGACGYTTDIANAGLFERAKADSYNDGDRNEAFHVSEKLRPIHAAMLRHNEAIEALLKLDHAAQGIEARRAETAQTGSVHESPVAESDAPNPKGHTGGII